MIICFFPLDTSLFYSQVAHPLTLLLPLPCLHIFTARNMTSRLHYFVGGLSFKKADVYYWLQNISDADPLRQKED